MNMFREALLLWRGTKGERTISLQLRLFAFLSLFVLVLALTFVLVLALSGVFSVGARECRVWMERELDYLAEAVAADFGKLSLRGIEFARQISAQTDEWMQRGGLTADDLQARPETLEGLLSAVARPMLSFLQNNKCTGVFIVLDQGAEPDSSDERQYRAGIFFKRTEPNVIDLIGSKIYCLRGPASVARESGVELMAQWRMGFDAADSDFYRGVLDAARDRGAPPLSRLYRWSERSLLKGNSGPAMLLCIPLLGENGATYGVCGIEVSSMLFKLQYSPDNSRYPHVFAAFSPALQGALDAGRGLAAGNSYLTQPVAGQLRSTGDRRGGFSSYRAEDGISYIGLQQSIRLYPSGSPYEGEQWALAVVMPEESFRAYLDENRLLLYGAVSVSLILSLLLALFVSRRYIKPVAGALALIQSDNPSDVARTNIAEIDDLLEFLAEQDRRREQELAEQVRQAQAAGPNLAAYEEFVRSIGALSVAERAVFDLYMEGRSVSEISKILCITTNTIKTHNRRIYNKLNVTSRKELMVYVQMMDDRAEAE